MVTINMYSIAEYILDFLSQHSLYSMQYYSCHMQNKARCSRRFTFALPGPNNDHRHYYSYLRLPGYINGYN